MAGGKELREQGRLGKMMGHTWCSRNSPWYLREGRCVQHSREQSRTLDKTNADAFDPSKSNRQNDAAGRQTFPK